MGLAIDAACDLPQAFLQKHNIAVMPITIHVDNEVFMDNRNQVELHRFLDRNLGSRSHAAETL
ncbi:MAG TPA: DegV family protein, partial [Dyella sp.]|uniref:DegV family protein n=1 Tax=Dyella sp. TaxID=1869338 RepID=UPI002D779377